MHCRPVALGEQRLWDRWRANAHRTPEREAIVHYEAGEPTRRWRWGELLQKGSEVADWLVAEGVRAGDVCAMMIRHHAEVYPLYVAIESIGAIPSILAYPNPRLHPDKFRQGLLGMSRASGLDWILTERDLEDLIAPIITQPGSTIRGVLFPLHPRKSASKPLQDPEPVRSGGQTPDDACLLQHSSGTTGLQKAVMLSHRAVLEHVHRYGSALRLSPDDRIVSWLPLYHDMGLIAAFHLPLALAIPTVLLDPFEWVAAPSLFLHAVSQERGSIGWLPNFAYNLMASRIHDEDMDGVRLDSLRALVNCSEPVRAESHDVFVDRFSTFGLRRETITACYAMAETTFAISQSPVGCEARRFNAARDSLAAGRAISASPGEAARVCVSSGTPISGCAIRVIGSSGDVLPDADVGELHVRSVSLFSGYRNVAAQIPPAIHDGWYATGDYGFLLDGEVYVIGRKKDIIIVAGKNLYPEDIEHAVCAVEGVIPGRAVAFGLDDAALGTERVCVVAETTLTETDAQERLREAIVKAGMHVDVTISEVHFVAPRWLIKSSAGKPSRSANKQRILAKERTLELGGA